MVNVLHSSGDAEENHDILQLEEMWFEPGIADHKSACSVSVTQVHRDVEVKPNAFCTSVLGGRQWSTQLSDLWHRPENNPWVEPSIGSGASVE